MNEINTLIVTTFGLAIILLVCVLLFVFILIDLMKNVRFNGPRETGKRIVNYFSEKDKELD